MANNRTLKSFQLLSFDIYGTLVDWEAGIHAALEPLLQRAAVKTDLNAEFARHERAIQRQNPRLTYNLVLKAAYEGLAKELGALPESERLLDEEATAFSNSIGRWPAFPDTVAAMLRLKHAGFKLVALSNVDHESFSRTLAGPLAGLGESFFNAVYTAQDIGSYKPDARNFEYLVSHVRTEFGIAASDFLHVAQSLHHDHEPAKLMGLSSVWIARGGGDSAMGGAVAEYVDCGKVSFGWRFDTLAALADAST